MPVRFLAWERQQGPEYVDEAGCYTWPSAANVREQVTAKLGKCWKNLEMSQGTTVLRLHMQKTALKLTKSCQRCQSSILYLPKKDSDSWQT